MSTAASICARCSALLVLALPGHAGFMKQWSLEELAQAGVLAVSRVESVTVSSTPSRQVGDRVPVHRCTADLAVLRSFGKVPEHLELVYDCYKDYGPGVSGYPTFPRLERGQVRVFPLNRSGATWALIAPEGVGLLIP